jgi:hypothetical protein
LQKVGVGLVVGLACLFACTMAKAVSKVSLQWSPDTDSSVAGYNIYYGGASRAYTNVVDAGAAPTAEVGGLMEGQTYYFAVTAYDEFGDESDYSDETVYVVPGYLTLTPGTPVQIRFSVALSHMYELQVSQDLRNWTTIWQVIGTSNTWVEFDAPTINSAAQFFRVVLH